MTYPVPLACYYCDGVERSAVVQMPTEPSEWNATDLHLISWAMVRALGIEVDEAGVCFWEHDGEAQVIVFDQESGGRVMSCVTAILPIASTVVAAANALQGAAPGLVDLARGGAASS